MKRARGDQHTVDVCADTHPVSYQSCVFSPGLSPNGARSGF